jgi:hypothetical protein
MRRPELNRRRPSGGVKISNNAYSRPDRPVTSARRRGIGLARRPPVTRLSQQLATLAWDVVWCDDSRAKLMAPEIRLRYYMGRPAESNFAAE